MTPDGHKFLLPLLIYQKAVSSPGFISSPVIATYNYSKSGIGENCLPSKNHKVDRFLVGDQFFCVCGGITSRWQMPPLLQVRQNPPSS